MMNRHESTSTAGQSPAHPGCARSRRTAARQAGLLVFCTLLAALLPRLASAGTDEKQPINQTPEQQRVAQAVARGIARSMPGQAGGLTVAVWQALAPSGTGTRFLTRSQTVFHSYPDFLRKFSRQTTDPAIAQSRILLMTAHGGYGQGLQTVVDRVSDLDIPPQIQWDTNYAPLEFVSLSRILADLGDKYDLIILGQCNARACLRTVNASLPVDEELLAQIRRLSDRPRQLAIVRNVDEDIYLVGPKVVLVRPHTPPESPGPQARVIAPDGVGVQLVYDMKRSSMTDVYILAGVWTDQPLLKISEETMRPTKEMIRAADALVANALKEERRAMAERRERLRARNDK